MCCISCSVMAYCRMWTAWFIWPRFENLWTTGSAKSTVAYVNYSFFSSSSSQLCGRFLEEGNVDGAEEQKQRIEQLQRERRKVLQDNNMTHKPRFFKYVMWLWCFLVKISVLSWQFDKVNFCYECWLLDCCVCRKSNNDTWVSNNTYWDLRREPGFSKIDFPVLWWRLDLTRMMAK